MDMLLNALFPLISLAILGYALWTLRRENHQYNKEHSKRIERARRVKQKEIDKCHHRYRITGSEYIPEWGSDYFIFTCSHCQVEIKVRKKWVHWLTQPWTAYPLDTY